MGLTMEEFFTDSHKLHPSSRAPLSKAECGFILPEIEALVAKYDNELDDPEINPRVKQMIAHHLEGLRLIEAKLKKAFHPPVDEL